MADLDLARRAVAATGWRWMPGMRAFDVAGRPFRINAVHAEGGVLATLGEPGFSVIPMSRDAMARCLPDLDDPATVGCLLALVRERWGDPEIWMTRHPHWTARGWVTAWQVVAGHRYEELRRSDRHRGTTLAEGSTEAAALVAALEAPHA